MVVHVNEDIHMVALKGVKISSRHTVRRSIILYSILFVMLILFDGIVNDQSASKLPPILTKTDCIKGSAGIT